MPRPLRPQIAGGVYHVMTHGIRDEPIFVDDSDRAIFVALLALVALRYECEIEAYCLVGNHYHLIVRTPHANISAFMQRLNSRYAQLFNHRHEYERHLFGSRFCSVVIEDEEQLARTIAYVEYNAVEAGLCRTPAEWPWCSYRARNGLPGIVTVELASFAERLARDPAQAEAVFWRFAASHLRRPRPHET